MAKSSGRHYTEREIELYYTDGDTCDRVGGVDFSAMAKHFRTCRKCANVLRWKEVQYTWGTQEWCDQIDLAT
jgi:hypothetical protein